VTTYYPYQASPSAPFSFQPTLDGAQYLATVKWNIYGQRNYLFLTQLDGTPVVTIPVVPSPPSVALESISWTNGTVTAVTAVPHGYAIGLLVQITISGCNPSAYNGAVLAYVLDAVTLTYPLIANPGMATMIGLVDWTINLVQGYFTTSSIVFRNSQFEVAP
jgi:hypothetical protein